MKRMLYGPRYKRTNPPFALMDLPQKKITTRDSQVLYLQYLYSI